MFNLTAHVKTQPMLDEPYKRHLEAADIFNAVREAREAYERAWVATAKAMIAEAEARKALKAEVAKAKLYESTL